MPRWVVLAIVATLTTVSLSAGIGLSAEPGPISRAEAFARAAALTEIGRQIFNDPALSASGRQACSYCHDPAHAFGPANAKAVQAGGRDMSAAGTRAVPTLRYLQPLPPFTAQTSESQSYGDAGPSGGMTWDGRVDRGRDQARIPLMSPVEMANADPAEVVARARQAAYAPDLQKLFGDDVFDDPERGLDAVTTALETYEEDFTDFYAYTSKFDAYIAGKAQLTQAEQHGLALFEDENKGNCTSCHPSRPGTAGVRAEFSTFVMFALGVPRNPEIPANADPAYFDMGLCGPYRTDYKDNPAYCGLFRTPTLRNVAVRQTFFHNGAFHDLRTVVEFYATRDTDPGHWYPRSADGTVDEFNDLPQKYHVNVDSGAPFGRSPGDAPALSESEIDDLVAFLKTLTDGYTPGH